MEVCLANPPPPPLATHLLKTPSEVDCKFLSGQKKIFSHKGHDFERKLPNTKCVFLFSPQLLSKTFLILRTAVRDTKRNVIGLIVKSRYSGQV